MSENILVVEHHDDLRRQIVETLLRQHHRCEGVALPSDAMLRVREHRYSYVVIDLDAPRSTAALMELVAEHRHLAERVVVITEDDLAEIDVYADEQISFLRKPFGRRELLAQFATKPGQA
jgi:DNA-binding response OmpR family regulator